MGIAAPALAAGIAWLGYDIVQQRLAGRGWENVWLLAIVIATLCGLVLLFLTSFAHVLRGKLTVGEEGIEMRGIFRTRTIPWKRMEGYRWIGGRMNVYLADAEMPIEVGYFEDRATLYALFQSLLPDLDAAVTEREAREIRDDLSLGLTQPEKDARLAEMRRLAKAVNWTAYVIAGAGGANALVLGPEWLQLLAACVLVLLPLVLLALALANPNRLRLDYREGSIYPEGASGIIASSMGLGLMAALDPHTLLGERFFFWAAGLAAVFALAWVYVERERLAEHLRSIVGALNVLGIACFAAFWASGSVYLANKHADVSPPVWATTKVTGLRVTGRSGKSHLAKVAPWGGLPEAVELDVPREAYRALTVGMEVEVGVRAGALDIPWVATVRPARKP
jgi:hypothetical protein